MAYPDPAKLGGARDRGSRLSGSTLDIDKAMLSKARRVLSYSAELAGMVMADQMPLNEAYDQATAF